MTGRERLVETTRGMKRRGDSVRPNRGLRVLLFYAIATYTMKTLLFLFTRWRVEGMENVPRTGPLIVVANHLNVADPPLLSASIPRRIVFMAKEELFRSRGRWFVRAFGAFAVRRGKMDREAFHQALEVLGSGSVLGMFPEGTRSPGARMQQADVGSSLIALRSGAPVLPVGISGSEHISGLSLILRRPRITVTIGRPVFLPISDSRPGKDQLPRIADSIMRHVAGLLPPSYRGVYAETEAPSDAAQQEARWK